MANPEHVEIVKQGLHAIDDWRQKHPDTLLDLSAAKLSEANLGGANLSQANLCDAELMWCHLTGVILNEANLIRAHLWETRLGGADLRGADLSGAELVGADLSHAKLNKTNLRRSKLHGTKFNASEMTEANVVEAVIAFTTFNNVDLSHVKGLELVQHTAPSSIDVATLYKSKGQIPEVFLRGCGVPEALITYLPSLIGAMEPIQFQSCFISYSSKDDEFARRLHGRMRDEKLRVWFDQEDMQGGKKVMEQIDRAIQVNDRLLLVLSESSLKSEWVKTEIRKARRVERSEGRRKLFPIRLVSVGRLEKWKCLATDPDEDLAAEVRSYHIPDFSNWKDHDAFEAAFADLLRDLRAEA